VKKRVTLKLTDISHKCKAVCENVFIVFIFPDRK